MSILAAPWLVRIRAAIAGAAIEIWKSLVTLRFHPCS
jgi:hypothetical protein